MSDGAKARMVAAYDKACSVPLEVRDAVAAIDEYLRQLTQGTVVDANGSSPPQLPASAADLPRKLS